MGLPWALQLALPLAVLVSVTTSGCRRPEVPAAQARPVAHNPLQNRTLPHLDHRPFFTRPLASPQDVTRACLRCHPQAAEEVMKTAHWTWLSGDVVRGGKQVRIGKKNNINNFCISVNANWKSCSRCHAGYGYTDPQFDFGRAENVDCLVCHDGSGTYAKDQGGLPASSVVLATVAGSVRRPHRDNCGACHFSGGGGMGVKHGDLDDTLLNAGEELDVHMGRLDFQCVDCHKTRHHLVPGKVNATYTEATPAVRFDCSECHTAAPHTDARLNQHTARVACQTCHIPSFARKAPTKLEWDWSTAGKSGVREDPHEYLKIKGSFRYGGNVAPEYGWYNGKMERYVTGDRLGPGDDHAINRPLGARADATAKIWPFKIHRAKQPYDPVNRLLLPPVTAGEGGYWSKFDWAFAIRRGAELAGLPYSGQYGFVKTHMYWPITHMTAPAKDALQCLDCHSRRGRLDWGALGYAGDPVGGKTR